mmetsp:Transcript_19910/g.37132  ORF Transcript_19910/g.37132 Transcript_19910/m.37132 type:complete len:214 (-) Transcript_19910:70-711(-)
MLLVRRRPVREGEEERKEEREGQWDVRVFKRGVKKEVSSGSEVFRRVENAKAVRWRGSSFMSGAYFEVRVAPEAERDWETTVPTETWEIMEEVRRGREEVKRGELERKVWREVEKWGPISSRLNSTSWFLVEEEAAVVVEEEEVEVVFDLDFFAGGGSSSSEESDSSQPAFSARIMASSSELLSSSSSSSSPSVPDLNGDLSLLATPSLAEPS